MNKRLNDKKTNHVNLKRIITKRFPNKFGNFIQNNYFNLLCFFFWQQNTNSMTNQKKKGLTNAIFNVVNSWNAIWKSLLKGTQPLYIHRNHIILALKVGNQNFLWLVWPITLCRVRKAGWKPWRLLISAVFIWTYSISALKDVALRRNIEGTNLGASFSDVSNG